MFGLVVSAITINVAAHGAANVQLYPVYPERGLLTHANPFQNLAAFRSICRSPHEYQGQGSSMTISCTVFHLKNEVMWVAAGQQSHSDYQSVRMPGAPDRRSGRAA